jgi:hypothetical protein
MILVVSVDTVAIVLALSPYPLISASCRSLFRHDEINQEQRLLAFDSDPDDVKKEARKAGRTAARQDASGRRFNRVRFWNLASPTGVLFERRSTG